MTLQSPPEKPATALGFSYQVALDKEGRRNIVLQSHLPMDATIEEINQALDKCAAAADHQIDGYRLTEYVLVEQELGRLIERAKKDLAYIDVSHVEEYKARHRGSDEGFKRTAQQEAQRANAVRSIEVGENDLVHKREDMVALRKRLAEASGKG